MADDILHREKILNLQPNMEAVYNAVLVDLDENLAQMGVITERI
jgi:hypothetical protein